ncbi:MAG: hypothetical protein AB1546_03840 [bacterium]
MKGIKRNRITIDDSSRATVQRRPKPFLSGRRDLVMRSLGFLPRSA